jgi:hypothetical protein
MFYVYKNATPHCHGGSCSNSHNCHDKYCHVDSHCTQNCCVRIDQLPSLTPKYELDSKALFVVQRRKELFKIQADDLVNGILKLVQDKINYEGNIFDGTLSFYTESKSPANLIGKFTANSELDVDFILPKIWIGLDDLVATLGTNTTKVIHQAGITIILADYVKTDTFLATLTNYVTFSDLNAWWATIILPAHSHATDSWFVNHNHDDKYIKIGDVPGGVVSNATITFTQGGIPVTNGSFTLNQSSNKTIDFALPGSTITIDTTWPTPLTDATVPSTKLVKTALDGKAPSVHDHDATYVKIEDNNNHNHLKYVESYTVGSNDANTIPKILRVLSQAAYNGLVTKNANTIYFTTAI